MTTPFEDEVDSLVNKAKPLFAGQAPCAVGAALADLLALWLACHRTGKYADTKELHEDLLESHIEAVRALIPIHQKEIFQRAITKGAH